MRLLAIADLHGKLENLEQILRVVRPVDVVLLAGDLTHFGTPEQAEQIVRQAQAVCPTVFAVAGNCDCREICDRLRKVGVSVHGVGKRVGEVGFHGLAAIPTWKTGMYQMSEDELAEVLQAGLADVAGAPVRVLLTHVPPYGTSLDRVFLGRHCGSRALRQFVETHRPALLVCGHIHESAGVEDFGPTVMVNCGPAARGSYALVDLVVRTAADADTASEQQAAVKVRARICRL